MAAWCENEGTKLMSDLSRRTIIKVTRPLGATMLYNILAIK